MSSARGLWRSTRARYHHRVTHLAPKVHVLLLNWNRWQDTVDCLESLFRLDYPNFTVVLCDNASTDGSVDRVKSWASGRGPSASEPPLELRPLVSPAVPKPIRLVEYSREVAERGGDSGTDSPEPPLVVINTGSNLGFAGGNNVGLRYIMARSEARLVWVLNNDILVAPEALALLVNALSEAPGTGAVSARLLDYREPQLLQMAGGGRFVPWKGHGAPLGPDSAERVEPPDYVTAGCMLMPVDAVRRVGTIDERYFMYVEDVDYSLRLRQSRFKLAYCPAARVWHKGNVTVALRSERHDYYTARNGLMLVRRFYPLLLPVAFAYSAYRCLLPKLVRLQPGRARAVLRAYRDFLTQVSGPMPETK